MTVIRKTNSSAASRSFDGRLAGYLTAAGAVTAAMATEAHSAVVANTTVQPFGVNGDVNIDFNQDGQTDFQIDHDQVTLPNNGPTLNYLQIDKNDVNGASNPLAFDPGPGCCFAATPFSDGASARNAANDSAYIITGPQGSYPAAMTAGSLIGPAQTFDFQESNNFQGTGKWIRANRLIDQDATQIDQVLGGQPASGVQVPFSGPNFTGLSSSDVRYLGVKMNLNGTGDINYGWIGIRITNQALATGEVVGYGYQTTAGAPIGAGEVPEPTTLFGALFGGVVMIGFLWRRLLRR